MSVPYNAGGPTACFLAFERPTLRSVCGRIDESGMIEKRSIGVSQAIVVLCLVGCVGTDHIADPPMAMSPRIEIRPEMAAVEIGDVLDLK